MYKKFMKRESDQRFYFTKSWLQLKKQPDRTPLPEELEKGSLEDHVIGPSVLVHKKVYPFMGCYFEIHDDYIAIYARGNNRAEFAMEAFDFIEIYYQMTGRTEPTKE